MDKETQVVKILERSRARKALIAIIVIFFILVASLIVISILISYFRREIDLPVLTFEVDNPLWSNTASFCDPYGITAGSYRLGFFSAASAGFAHVIKVFVKNGTEPLGAVVVPPDALVTSAINYSIVLPGPGMYTVTNTANNKFIGQFDFTYPNQCQ